MITTDQYALLAIVFVFTACAALLDWRSKRLPNWLTVSFAAAGLLFHLVVGFAFNGLPGLGTSFLHCLGGFAVGFGLLFILWAIGASGGGDVKYTAALGTWLGATPTFYVIAGSVCIVAAASILLLAYQVVSKGFGKTKHRYLEKPASKKLQSEEARQQQMVSRRLMPWAVPTALATWIVLAIQTYHATQG